MLLHEDQIGLFGCVSGKSRQRWAGVSFCFVGTLWSASGAYHRASTLPVSFEDRDTHLREDQSQLDQRMNRSPGGEDLEKGGYARERFGHEHSNGMLCFAIELYMRCYGDNVESVARGGKGGDQMEKEPEHGRLYGGLGVGFTLVGTVSRSLGIVWVTKASAGRLECLAEFPGEGGNAKSCDATCATVAALQGCPRCCDDASPCQMMGACRMGQHFCLEEFRFAFIHAVWRID